MRPFRIAIIGCGDIARRVHAPMYASHADRVQVVAACDTVGDQATRLAADIPGCEPFSSLTDAIENIEWDIGVICSPPVGRVEIVTELAGAGKHIFVEKPMASDLNSARKIVSVAEASGVKLAVHQNFRYYYPFDMARSLISEGRIGQVRTVIHRELSGLYPEGSWKYASPRYALSQMGIHWFDGFRWMLRQEPSVIWCQTHSSPLMGAVGDTDAVVHAMFTGGTTVSYVESFASPAKYELETTVLGESGSLRLHLHGIEEWRTTNDGSSLIMTPHNNLLGRSMPDATWVSMSQLLQAIEDDTSPSNSGSDNLGSIAALEAAYQSGERGELVEVASL